MSKHLLTYRCLVISPSDVSDHRDAVEEAIKAWNAHTGPMLDARIEAVRWESHACPEMGGSPQDILNRQIVDGADFGIAIFWGKIGTPTKEHPSGSAEEVSRLLQRGARVMVYFSNAAVPQEILKKDAKQFSKLQKLRQRYEQEGLLSTFETVDQLREMVTLHVNGVVTGMLVKDRTGDRPIPASGSMTLPTPDIRVGVNAGFTYGGGRESQPIMTIEVQNHSPMPFFLSSIVLECSDGAQMYVPRDCATGEPQRPRTIAPGDSASLMMDPFEVVREAQQSRKEIVSAAAKDKIGRVFRSQPGVVNRVLTTMVQDHPSSGPAAVGADPRDRRRTHPRRRERGDDDAPAVCPVGLRPWYVARRPARELASPQRDSELPHRRPPRPLRRGPRGTVSTPLRARVYLGASALLPRLRERSAVEAMHPPAHCPVRWSRRLLAVDHHDNGADVEHERRAVEHEHHHDDERGQHDDACSADDRDDCKYDQHNDYVAYNNNVATILCRSRHNRSAVT